MVAAATLLVALGTLVARPGEAGGQAMDSTRWVRLFPGELETFTSELFQRVRVIRGDSTDPVARVLDMADRLQIGDEVRLHFFTAPPHLGSQLYVDLQQDVFVAVRVRGDGTAFGSAAAVFREHWLRTLSPIDSVVRLGVRERVPDVGRAPEPRLGVTTARQYSCLGYRVEGDVDRAGDTLRLRLLGIASPRGLCSQAIGPARGDWPLPDTAGRYFLRVTYGDRADLYRYEVTDTTLRLVAPDAHPGAGMFSETGGHQVHRARPQTFAYMCHSPEITAYICDRVLDWLRSRPGLEPFRFPDDGVVPFRRAGDDARFFHYTWPEALAEVERCFEDVLAEGVRNSVGVSLTIELWDRRLITAWSERSFHEPNSAPSPRLTESCAGG